MGIRKRIDQIKNLVESSGKNSIELREIESDLINHISLMEEILESIPYLVGVIRPDFHIVFLNKYGYEFFDLNRQEARTKRCFELLNLDSPCEFCILNQAIKEKKAKKICKYLKEYDAYVEFYYNPTFNSDGNIDLIIMEMRDVSKEKKAEMALRDRERNYKSLFELSPEGAMLINRDKIVMSNTEMAKILGYDDVDDLIGQDFLKMVHYDYYYKVRRERSRLLSGEEDIINTEFKMIKKNRENIKVVFAAKLFDYKGENAIHVLARDNSKKNLEIEQAAKIQRVRMEKGLPRFEKINLEKVYLAKDQVSGDFLHIFKPNENLLVGFLGDFNGHGVSAALCNSGVKVMLNDIIKRTYDPVEILNILNEEIPKIFNEEYVAGIAFKLNFKTNKIEISSAGINEFAFGRKDGRHYRKVLKSPHLGMLNHSLFETEELYFEPGDRFYFYTDGFDDSGELLDSIPDREVHKLGEIRELIDRYYRIPDNITDDIFWVGMEIK